MRDPQANLFDKASILARHTESLATLEWAVSLIPEDWIHRSPSGTKISAEKGAWSVAMNLAHLTLYTERLPNSVLASLLEGGDGLTGSWFGEPSPYEPDAVALAAMPVGAIMERLKSARARERTLALGFSDDAWTRPQTTAWGGTGYGPRLHSPARVVAKSVQHSWEHGNSILRVALFLPRDLIED